MGMLAHFATYIEENPVRAGIAKKAGDYKYTGLGAAKKGDETAQNGISGIYFGCPICDAMASFEGMLAVRHFEKRSDELISSAVAGGASFTKGFADVTHRTTLV